VSLAHVAREWGRIGALGFGGPPTHIALLRELCVDRKQWLHPQEFEDAVAACNLLPGPASTQLAIFSAWRVAGRPGALVGGAAFIIPGLAVILALAVLFLSASAPAWVRGAGAGAGAAVAAVAVQAGLSLVPASWARTPRRVRWFAYALLGGISAATVGPWLVLVLLGCGAFELAWQLAGRGEGRLSAFGWPLAVVAAASSGGTLALAWVAFKVGALAYGGGFVIVPLMQADAVDRYGWMTDAEFLNAVALGQITPGPVTQTIAVVGYAAGGIAAGVFAALVAFAPSFAFVLLGASRFDRIRADRRARAFLDGAGPAAIGAIVGVAVPLTLALSEGWQFAVLTGAAILLLPLRRGVVPTLLLAGAVGALVGVAGGPLP
jgi:chromate transporter